MRNDYIDWLTVIPNWLSAIGTLAAVIVALWLASRDRRLRIRGSATIYVLLDPAAHSEEEFVTVTLVNTGSRTFNVTGITWRTGLFRRRYFWQVPNFGAYSSTLPVRLSDGDQANYHIPKEAFVQNSRVTIVSHMPRHFRKLWARSIRVIIQTSTGHSAKLKLAKNLRQLIVTGEPAAA